MHGHYGATQEGETNEISLCSTFQKRESAREGEGQEEELGDEFVLGQTLDEFAPHVMGDWLRWTRKNSE
jgi:hypothetical protein